MMYNYCWWQNFLENAKFFKNNNVTLSWWSHWLILATLAKKEPAKKAESSSEESSSDEEEAKPATMKKGISIRSFSEVLLVLDSELSWRNRIFEK